MSTAIAAPRRNMLIGITHLSDGTKIIRESKVLKVGVGLPRGKAVDVYVDQSGDWNIRQGNVVGGTGKLKFETVAKVKTRAEAEVAWRKAYDAADLCNYPRKVSYFVFTRPMIGKDGAEVYVPDFAATEAYSFADKAHPGAPTEIDVVFLDDSPFSGSYAMWSSSELRCSGDGENAARSVAMYADAAKVPEALRTTWAAAKAAGERTFNIPMGCWTCNCPFAKADGAKPAPCKPSADLKFQLTRNIRVGGTAFFHTSGYRSIVQIFSAVERIKELTGGRIAGIPLKMVLRSYKTNFQGQPALQSGVSLEFRAEDFESVRRNLIEQAYKFRQSTELAPPPRMIESADEPLESMGDDIMSASSMTAEFYPDNDEDTTDEPVVDQASARAAAASNATVSSLAEKLKAAKATEAKSEPAAKVAELKPAPAPPASNVTEMPVKSRWSSGDEMKAAFKLIRTQIGPEEFKRLSSDVTLDPERYTDTKIAECYVAMDKRWKEMQAPAAATDGEALF